jgi:hypothetical protein
MFLGAQRSRPLIQTVRNLGRSESLMLNMIRMVRNVKSLAHNAVPVISLKNVSQIKQFNFIAMRDKRREMNFLR